MGKYLVWVVLLAIACSKKEKAKPTPTQQDPSSHTVQPAAPAPAIPPPVTAQTEPGSNTDETFAALERFKKEMCACKEYPPPAMGIYGGAKAAVRNMVRSWIYDIKGSGIRMNVLSPGTVDTLSLRTAMTKATGAERATAAVNAIAARSPSARIGTPREIGTVAAFLCSDAASYVNGVELFADGGLIAAV
jgi:NAD(P)-dependent dehydrogenase (short-subunit alcohol dehydrogenase family)